jgi:hypothetical protein
MERALDAGAEGGSAEVQAHLHLKLSGQLLLRVDAPENGATAHASESGKHITLTARVRERLEKADRGCWVDMLNELRDEVRADHHSPAAAQPGCSAQSASAMQQAADAEWTRETLTLFASRGRVGATRAASQILAGSMPVPPGPAATAAISRLFVSDRLETAIRAAMALPVNIRSVVQAKHVTRSGRSLHAPAAPGPWGFRNSYICSMLAHPRGPRTLARWTNFWQAVHREKVLRLYGNQVSHTLSSKLTEPRCGQWYAARRF